MKDNQTVRIDEKGSCRGISVMIRDTPREQDNLIQVRFERTDETLDGSHFEMFLSPNEFCELLEPIREAFFNVKSRERTARIAPLIEAMSRQKQLDFFKADDKNEVRVSLEMNISDNFEFKNWIRSDEKNAQALYHTLCNNVFYHRETGKEWHCSWRYAGGVVSDVLCKGDYLSWYCSGEEGHLDEQIVEWFDKMGWEPVEQES